MQVQNQVGNHPSRWDITGTVVEVKEHDQYVVKVHGSGRLTARNRKFLRKITPYCSTPPIHTSIPIPATPEDSEGTLSQLPQPTQDHVPQQPAVEIESTGVEPALPDNVDDTAEGQPRRSSRVRHAPDRLNIESTRGQSYLSEVKTTACKSVSVSTTSFHSGLVGGKTSMMMEDDCLPR